MVVWDEEWWFGMRNGGLGRGMVWDEGWWFGWICVCGARRTMVSAIHPLGLLIRDSVHEIVSCSDVRIVDWSTY